jgi:hypothetical protein
MTRYRAHKSEATVVIEIGKSSALVLNELLHRWEQSEDDTVVQIEHDAEWHALSIMTGALERQLVEPFAEDYNRILEQAREAIVEQYGSVDR